MTSQITSLAIVYSTVYSSMDQRKHQSSAPLAFVRGIHHFTALLNSKLITNISNTDMLRIYKDVAIVRWLKASPGASNWKLQYFRSTMPKQSVVQTMDWPAKFEPLPIVTAVTHIWSARNSATKHCPSFNIMLMSSGRHGGNSKLCSTASSDLTTNEISMLHFTGPLWGESTSDWWIPLTKGQ